MSSQNFVAEEKKYTDYSIRFIQCSDYYQNNAKRKVYRITKIIQQIQNLSHNPENDNKMNLTYKLHDSHHQMKTGIKFKLDIKLIKDTFKKKEMELISNDIARTTE